MHILEALGMWAVVVAIFFLLLISIDVIVDLAFGDKPFHDWPYAMHVIVPFTAVFAWVALIVAIMLGTFWQVGYI